MGARYSLLLAAAALASVASDDAAAVAREIQRQYGIRLSDDATSSTTNAASSSDAVSTRRHTWWSRSKDGNHSGPAWLSTGKSAKTKTCGATGKICRTGVPSYGGWRTWVANIIAKEPNRDPSLTDIYQFGVYVGGSLLVIRTAWHLNELPVGNVWGFDSFIGLQTGAIRKGDHSDWADGAYSAADALGAKSMHGLKQQILRLLTEQSTTSAAKADWFGKKVGFVQGFFNESLLPGLVQKRKMRPALYVDIDVDQYLPTLQALDWMLSEGLIKPGTYVGYDDIGSTDKWTAGESRAQLEVAKKHGVRFKLVHNGCRKVGSKHPLHQKGPDELCPELKGCRLYYKLIFRVEAVEKGSEGSVC